MSATPPASPPPAPPQRSHPTLQPRLPPAWLHPAKELSDFAASRGGARWDFRHLKNFRREPEDVLSRTESRAFGYAVREGELSLCLEGAPAGSGEPGARAPVFLGRCKKFRALIWEITFLSKVRRFYCLRSLFTNLHPENLP